MNLGLLAFGAKINKIETKKKSMQRINETKKLLFDKMNMLNKPLVKLIRRLKKKSKSVTLNTKREI